MMDSEKLTLNAVSIGSKTPHAGYVFAMPAFPGTLTDFDEACRSFRKAGFNALYIIWPFFRSEDGSGTPWQEDIPPEDDRFPSVAHLGFSDRQSVETLFEGCIRVARRHNLSLLFNVGPWAPQTWLRKHPEAVSRLPDETIQYDWIFRDCGTSVHMPCFRSETYRRFSEKIIDAWFRKYHDLADFNEVVCRVDVEGERIRLERSGFELFFIHQDTMDRAWCCCNHCQEAFREDYLPRIYGSVDRLNQALKTEYSDFASIHLPAFPAESMQHGSAVTDRLGAENNSLASPLWFDASNHFSEAIHEWKRCISRAVRTWFPRADVMLISKHPTWPRITNFAAAARGAKVFLMDPYPMEFGMHWNLLAYLFKVEVYKSAATQNRQALFAHLQGFDNPRPGETSRAPTPAEFRQQHLGLLARGVGAMMTLSMNHAVDLSSPSNSAELLKKEEVERILAEWHHSLSLLERHADGTTAYKGGVKLVFCSKETCSLAGGTSLLKEYARWKTKGVPVYVEFGEKPTNPRVPKSFEFQLTNDCSDWDFVVRQGKDRFLLFLINLRNQSRSASVAVSLQHQDMAECEVQCLFGANTHRVVAKSKRFTFETQISALEGAVFEIRLRKEGQVRSAP